MWGLAGHSIAEQGIICVSLHPDRRLPRLFFFCLPACLPAVWDPTFGSSDSITTTGYNQ